MACVLVGDCILRQRLRSRHNPSSCPVRHISCPTPRLRRRKTGAWAGRSGDAEAARGNSALRGARPLRAVVDSTHGARRAAARSAAPARGVLPLRARVMHAPPSRTRRRWLALLLTMARARRLVIRMLDQAAALTRRHVIRKLDQAAFGEKLVGHL